MQSTFSTGEIENKNRKWQNSIKKPENCGATCFPAHTQITYLLHRLTTEGYFYARIYHFNMKKWKKPTLWFVEKNVALPFGNAI